MSLKGKVAVVTGGNGGIGFGFATGDLLPVLHKLVLISQSGLAI